MFKRAEIGIPYPGIFKQAHQYNQFFRAVVLEIRREGPAFFDSVKMGCNEQADGIRIVAAASSDGVATARYICSAYVAY
jgi:hypothetical protein